MARFDGSRVVAPDVPDSQPLQVADSSGLNFFAAPARPVQDNNMERLADALGSFSSDVQRFGAQWKQAHAQDEEKQTKADMEAAKGLIASKTPAEWQDAVKNGSLPAFASPMAQAAVDRTTGQYAAHSLANDVQAKVASGELSYGNGSAQKYLDDQRQQIVKTNGWGQNSGQMLGFGDGFNTIWNNVQSKSTQAAVENMNEAHNQAAFQQIDMAVDNAFKNKLSPDATWEQLNKVRQGLISTMHFEPKELDPVLFDALKRRASTDPNWVMGVGNAERTDVDGKTKIPSLFSKNTYADQVQALGQHTQAFNAKAEDETQKANINNGVGQLLNTDSSKLYAVPEQIPYTNSVTGKQETVSKSEALSAATNARIVADNRAIASGQKTPAQVQDEQLQTFATAGIKQQQWADELNQGAKGGANFTSTSDPKQQGQALKAYQLYQDLRTKNPAYLGTLLDEKSKRLYENAFIQQSVFNKSPVDALQGAYEAENADKNPEAQADLDRQRPALESAATGLKWGGWFSPDIHNPDIAKGALKSAAQTLMRTNGMSAEEAIKTATPYVQNAFVPVNGVLIPDLHYLPKEQMQPAAEKYLSDWATGPAKALNLDPKSLSLAPYGTGRYVVTDAASGLPITHGDGMSYVTAKDLIAAHRTVQSGLEEKERAAVQQQIDDARTRIQRNQEVLGQPATPYQDPGVVPGL